MTVAVSTIIANVSKLLNDAGLVHWSQDELMAYGSEGQVELVKLKPDAATKTTTLQLVAGAKQAIPDDGITVVDIRRNNGGDAITPCDRNMLDRFSPGWMASPTASTVQHWMDDPTPEVFYVYPAQNTSPATVVLSYVFVPADLTALGDLVVSDIYQAQIENYILFRAFSKDAEAASAERAMAYGKAFYG